jgi:Ca2+-binding RTX toxin-like protein
MHTQTRLHTANSLSTDISYTTPNPTSLTTDLKLGNHSRSRAAYSSHPLIYTTNGNDTLSGSAASEIFTAGKGYDVFTGNGGQDVFVIGLGDGTKTITDFGGVGRGVEPTAAVIAEVDTLKFVGKGLTATNMQLTQKGADLEITFFGVKDSPTVILQNFALENLDNLRRSTGASVDIGNILFNGDKVIQDSFDVLNSDSTQNTVFNRRTVTFANDLNNELNGFDGSADVINAQAGNDIIKTFGGNDWVRGGLGNDTIDTGEGNDWIQGDGGQDTLTGGAGYDRFIYNQLAIAGLIPVVNAATGIAVNNVPDTILDFNLSEDQFGLSADLGLQQIHFRAGQSSSGDLSGGNVIVLQNGFANAAAAAKAIADNDAVTADAGAFVYFNTTLNISRLVHSKDLSDGGEITVLANLTNQTSVDSQNGFTSQNFTLI